MKSYLNILGSAALFLSVVSCGSGEQAEAKGESEISDTKTESVLTTYKIDTEKSKVMWKGTMLGMYSHEGTLDFTQGKFTMSGDELQDGEFIVDMKTINPTDDGYDPEAGKGPEVLVGHLSTDDFFNVAEYPTAALSMSNGVMTLKIRDKKNNVELKDFNYEVQGDLLEANGKVIFDRKNFDVAFDHPAKEMV
ncbi:MAG: YceI family protein, partial [Flavobacteriales bacterium]|nr:YceI family protein [Flavobacteriales bacterium]